MKEQQVQSLIQSKIGLYKDKSSGKKVELCAGYTDCCDMADRIAVHSDMHAFPITLFKSKAPNEDDGQWAYRKNNYRPVTMPYWNRATGVLNRIWNEQNYEIVMESNPDVLSYFNEEYPVYKSLVGYFESVVSRKKITDPNAILCIKPFEIPMMELDGEMKVADNEPVRPVAVIYPCSRIADYKLDEYALVELTEKSLVTVGSQPQKAGLIFELYDEEWIWRIEQYGDQKDYKFNYIQWYQHNLGYLPAWKLKGLPIDCEKGVMYKSYFFDAVPLLDEALYDASTLSISKVGAAFPHRWAVVDPCDYQGCTNGLVLKENGDGTYENTTCPQCKGTGNKPIFTPMGVREVKAGSATEDAVQTPPFGFVEPQLNTLEFLRTEIKENMVKAFAMLNIDVSTDVPTGKETATGKLIDREELHSFLLIFSNELFDLLGLCYNAIGTMRFGGFTPPVISAPATFAMRDEVDLTNELTKANDAKIPEIARRRIAIEFMQTRFTDSSNMMRITELIFKIDSLAAMQREEIADALVANTIPKWRDVLHINIASYIEQLLEYDPEFLEKDLKTQRETLFDMAKSEANDINSNKINIDQIVSNIGRK